MRFDRWMVVGAASALAAAPVAAQVPGTPRALGMGGAYVGVARGVESLFQNPANLGLPGSPSWSAAFPTLSAGLGTRGVSLGQVVDGAQWGDLDDAERDAILADIPADGTGLDVDLRAPVAALQMGRFAGSVSWTTLGGHTINRSIVDLLFNGFERDRTYGIENTQGTRAAFWDVAAAYGNRIGPVAIGATAHVYFPRTLVRSGLVDVDTTYSVISGNNVPSDIRVTYAGVRSEGGSGLGLDVGAAMQPIPGLTVSAALDNVFSTMAWKDELDVRSVILNQDDYQDGDVETVRSEYAQSKEAYDETTALPGTRALAASLRADRDAGLPMTLRVGAAYETRGTTLGAAYQKELDDDAPFGGLWGQQLSLGVQQRLWILALRAGAATDLEDGRLLSGGLSFGPVHLGVAHITAGKDGGPGDGWLDAGTTDGRREGWIATFGLGGRSDTSMR